MQSGLRLYVFQKWLSTLMLSGFVITFIGAQDRLVYVCDENKVPLIGAVLTNGSESYIIPEDGKLKFTCQSPFIEVSYVGYNTLELLCQDVPDTIILVGSNIILEEYIVTGSKIERPLSQTTVSVDIIKPSLLESTNAVSGSDILNKLPGVQVIGGQANIRGGSGFSYGAGSRVMVLIDDMPALQADAGFANWGDVPIEMIEQIEVLKGAASSLYGTAALNGIVNYRRKTPTSTPSTSLFSSVTGYLNPANLKYKWWGNSIPNRLTLGGAHTRKIKKLDLSSHFFLSKLDSYRKDTYEDKGRVGLNLKYHVTPKISIGVNTLFNYNNAQDYFLWFDNLTGIYKPFSGTLSSGKRIRYIIDPFVNVRDRQNNLHKLTARLYGINNQNNDNRSNTSSTLVGEYQYQNTSNPFEAIISIGATGTRSFTTAELYGDTSFTYTNTAVYGQFEKSISNLTISAGTRFEYNVTTGPAYFDSIPVPSDALKGSALVSRIGLSYQLNKGLSLRSSWGQGYRFPTISERFISTSFGGFNVFPNPSLTSERGWTAEVGAKQLIVLGNLRSYADISAFISRYDNMIEFVFLSDPLGFKPINVGSTSIPGIEGSWAGSWAVKEVRLNVLSGYTYINPVYLNFNERSEIKDNVSTEKNVLKYRSKHSAKFDLEAVYNNFSVAASWQYYSHMINIDRRLEEPFDGVDLLRIKSFRNQFDNGYKILDVRTALQFRRFKSTVILSNVLNEVYAVRPGLLEAPRNITIRLDYMI